MGEEVDRYRAAFERAFDAIVVADDEGCYIDANPSACELFGLDRDDLLGRSIEEFAPEGYDFESAWSEFRSSAGDRDTFPLIRADGERRTVEYVATPDVVSGEHLAILRDVTEREERERKLRETQSKYRQLVEQNLVGIYVIQDREFTYVNPRLAEIFGESPEEMIGRSPFEWIAEEDHERVEENLRQRESGEVDSLTFTVTGTRSDGERIRFQVHGGRVEIDDRPAILGALQDVTEREERERALRRKNRRLEEFADIVGHELRNPLNVARGRLELAREGGDDADDHLASAAGAIDRIDAIVEDLLLLAREGEAISEVEPVDLADVMEAAWGSVETADATLVADTTAVVRADRSRLQQLAENLFRNAVEHGSTGSQAELDDAVEHGGEDVTVTVGDLDDGFYVADDGPGVPADERDRVFESGYSTSDDGLGVGLSIVRRIAEAHGWTVAVTEAEDGGARFEFTGVDAG